MSSDSWFSRAVAVWYNENKRLLPWRATTDPYPVWLSEVILQQTRVDQGMAYWHRFMQRWPTIQDLAAAEEDEVLRQWQGLGYYSRARNLLHAARQVVREHGGQFPRTMDGLKELKGVGDYIAAAVGSICFGIPAPVVVGNVYRVLARFAGVVTPIDSTAGRKAFQALAAKLLNKAQPGDHNQAVMELGAMVCTPRRPACHSCPLQDRCVGHATGRVIQLPVKMGRTRITERHFNYLHIQTRDGIRLHKRTERDIWQGLYQLPLIIATMPLDSADLRTQLHKFHSGKWTIHDRTDTATHLLSHQRLHITYWRVSPPTGFRAPKEWILVAPHDLGLHAFPRPIERYLMDHDE